MRLGRLLDGRRVVLRRVAPGDAVRVQAFVRTLSPHTRYQRFLGVVNELGPETLSRLTCVDCQRSRTLVAQASDDSSAPITGIAEYVVDHDAQRCEFAIVVHDDWQSCGLGTLLLQDLKDSAAAAGLTHMRGDVLGDNRPMLRLARACGFTVGASPIGDYLLRVHTLLVPRPVPWAWLRGAMLSKRY
jgi:acetyltransferase